MHTIVNPLDPPLKCSENWCRDLIGIVVAALIAGIVLIFFTLALNMTVIIGTLNEILFYANIVSAKLCRYYVTMSQKWQTSPLK